MRCAECNGSTALHHLSSDHNNSDVVVVCVGHPEHNAKPTRPEPLPGPRPVMPDGRTFSWGPVDRIHEIGNITVVEFRTDQSNNITPSSWLTHGQKRFIPYVGRWGFRVFLSLDSALVGAIAYKRRGPNTQAAEHFDLMTLGEIPEQK